MLNRILAYLDAKSRRELQKDSNLNEIFENYVNTKGLGDDLLSWM